MRADGRLDEQLRPTRILPNFLLHAEGSVLVESGRTKVICTASVEDRVPPFLRNTGKGWVTAEYGMLPRATHTRGDREAARGKQSGRTQEIQRLIGRSLRAVVDRDAMGEMQITVDCDVLNADGAMKDFAGLGVTLDAEHGDALYVPTGFAHGSQTLADETEVLYVMGASYVPEAATGIRFDDPRVGVTWPARVALAAIAIQLARLVGTPLRRVCAPPKAARLTFHPF